MNNIIELTDENFDTIIKNSTKPIVVDFYAPWCGHCRTQSVILEQFANAMNEKVSVAKINVDENRRKATEFFISGIPAILVFNSGKLQEQKSGVHSVDDLTKIINQYIV